MSWLAAARNLVVEILAASASPCARQRDMRRVNSSVRSRTRRSSVSFDRSRASAASTLEVISVKVVTKPPSGMRFARTSMTMPSANAREMARFRNVAFELRAHELFGVVAGPRATAAVEAKDVGTDAGANQARR